MGGYAFLFCHGSLPYVTYYLETGATSGAHGAWWVVWLCGTAQCLLNILSPQVGVRSAASVASVVGNCWAGEEWGVDY